MVDQLQLNIGTDALWVMNVSLSTIMFGVALELTVQNFKDIAKKPKGTLLGVLSQFVMLPFLTWVIVIIFKPQPSIALGMMMVAACPGGNVSNFFSLLARGNAALSVSLTAIATVLAIFMTPINFSFWASMYEPTNEILREVSIDVMDVFYTIVLILGIPLTLGMLVRHHKPEIANKFAKYIKNFGILFFGGFVVSAFAMNYENFLDYVHLVLFIVFLHNLTAMTTGYTLGKLGGLPHTDRKSLAIETGIQNSGLGLLLIFNFFDGLGGMALVAGWWGIWHMVSGFTMSWYWSVGKKYIVRNK